MQIASYLATACHESIDFFDIREPFATSPNESDKKPGSL